MGRFGFIFDSSLCRGCNACQVACKDYKDLPVGFYFRRADTIKADGKEAWLHVTAACNHCTDAPCVKVCNAKGLFAEADGTISHRSAMCVACGRCAAACPYQAIFIDHDKKTARKCNGCKELRDMGQAPACVEACPNHALSYGDLDAFLLRLSEEERDLYTDHVSFLSHKDAKPNLLVKVKKELSFSVPLSVNLRLSNKTEKQAVIASLKKADTVHVGEKLIEAISFFKGGKSALTIMKAFGDYGDHTEKDWIDAYDRLFRGTDPFITLPLYASCKDGSRILLNEITLKVIHTYHDL